MKHTRYILVIILSLLLAVGASAQEDTATVPDLTGLYPPQAAAILNNNGLVLGTSTSSEWTEESGLQPDTIQSQSIEAGSTVARGTAVDLTVLVVPNVWLIYDNNDLTFINKSGIAIALGQVSFASADGSATFQANTWRNTLPNGDCTQLWSIARNEAKNLPECEGSIYWRTTNNSAWHFWTEVSGQTAFTVLVNGEAIVECPAAPRGSMDTPSYCQFFMPGSQSVTDFRTAFVYYAYTTEAFAVINTVDDHWMPLNNTTIDGENRQPKKISDMQFPDLGEIIGDLNQLAPGQCVLLTAESPEAAPPQDCHPIATKDIPLDRAFWRYEFGIRSTTDDYAHHCPAAIEGKLTLCIMPR